MKFRVLMRKPPGNMPPKPEYLSESTKRPVPASPLLRGIPFPAITGRIRKSEDGGEPGCNRKSDIPGRTLPKAGLHICRSIPSALNARNNCSAPFASLLQQEKDAAFKGDSPPEAARTERFSAFVLRNSIFHSVLADGGCLLILPPYLQRISKDHLDKMSRRRPSCGERFLHESAFFLPVTVRPPKE